MDAINKSDTPFLDGLEERGWKCAKDPEVRALAEEQYKEWFETRTKQIVEEFRKNSIFAKHIEVNNG